MALALRLPAGCGFCWRSGIGDWVFLGQPKEMKKKGLIAGG
jgi:hypothetical protein